MPQFIVLIAVLVLFYGWHKTNPTRVLPAPKKRKRIRRRNRHNNSYIEEDCLFEDEDIFESDWMTDPMYSHWSGNIFHHD